MGHTTGIAVLLLSLTAGAFLLAKIKKEDLGVFYRIVAWFVIVFSILLIACSAIRCIVGRQHKGHKGSPMMYGGFRHPMMGEPGDMMRERMMMDEGNHFMRG